MNRDRAQELKEFAQTIANRFSNPTRVGNQNHETFRSTSIYIIAKSNSYFS